MKLRTLAATLSMLMALLTLVETAAEDAATECPSACDCADGIEWEVACQWGGERLTVAAQLHRYAKVECDGGELLCERVPRLPGLRGGNYSLPSLGVRGCRLPPAAVGCAVRALGAAALGALRLAAPLDAAAAALLPPPPALRSLTIDASDVSTERREPRALLRATTALPELRRLTVRGARLLLEPDAFRDAPPLEWLELSLGAIERVPPGAFRGLGALRDLGLWRDGIVEIAVGAFDGLESLERLDVSSNALRSLAAGTLQGAARLRELRSVGNPLEALASDALAGAAQLEALVLRDCGAATLALGARALAALAALRTVRVERCGVLAAPPTLLAGSRALRELSLARNRLEALPPALLRDQPALRRLDLSGNRITELSADFFSALRVLEELNLDENHIEELPDMVFSGLSSVKSISANGNRLQRVSRSAFSGVATLERLSLADNELTMQSTLRTLPADGAYLDLGDAQYSPLAALVTLRELRLARNRVSELFYDWRVLMTQLRLLDLANNTFTNLTDNDLNFLSDNVTIDLRFNNITTIYVVRMEDVDDGNSRVLLDGNPFFCDCRLYGLVQCIADERRLGRERLVVAAAGCAAPPALAGVALAAAPLAELACPLPAARLPAACVATLRPAADAVQLVCDTPPAPAEYPPPADYGVRATELRLRRAPSAGQLAALPPHVRTLRLSGLALPTLPLARPPPSLTELDLTDNRLTSAPLEALAATPTLAVRLAGNPLACDCTHADDVAATQRLAARVLDYGALRCAGGGVLSGADASRLCSGRRAAALGGALALLALLAAASGALACRYSHELKVLLFARGWWPRRARDGSGEDARPYDVFVSFAHGDDEWVARELVPTLERGPRPLRVCVHYRDWAPGDLITTQIARSVEHSRCTLVLLSRHFVGSTWGRLEFRAAHGAALRERRARVVLVVLDDTSPADPRLEPELRAYLATNTYLRRDDPWFWQKLRYALPHTPDAKLEAKSGAKPNAKPLASALDVRLAPDGRLVNAAAAPAPAPTNATAPTADTDARLAVAM